MSYCDYRILSHISASSLAAPFISALANIAPTTAIPAIPVLDTFQKEGLLGCPDCYETFRENLKPFFRRAQEGIQHEGKAPGMTDAGKEEKTSPEIEQLKMKLAALVKEENYEEAARIRDEIKRLEQGGQS